MPSFNALVLDDHKMFVESFAELLKKVASFASVDLAYTVSSAKELLQKKKYDYLFMDLMIPGDDPSLFIAYCRAQFSQINIIVISSTSDPVLIKRLLGLGIDAFVSKTTGSEELKTAIERTWAGEKYISTDMSTRLASVSFIESKVHLTKKELEVMRNVAQGYTIAEMAKLMHLSPHTVISHRRAIMQKLGLRSATEIVRYAYENKIC